MLVEQLHNIFSIEFFHCRHSYLMKRFHKNYHLCLGVYRAHIAAKNGRDSTRTEELTKCYEPLQKLRVRLGACKTGLSPPVTLCY